jgi:ankyrin repeat protein
MATINGHFDLAMKLLERGADPRMADSQNATPLYGTINTQWIPKARHPQPADYLQQEVSHLELMQALLDAGADVNARIDNSLWYTVYDVDQLGVDRSGATAFWRAAYSLDVPAMKLLVANGADPHLPTAKVPERRRLPMLIEEGDPDPSGLPPAEYGDPAVYPIHAASGVGYGLGLAANSHRHAPDAWHSAVKYLVEECAADATVRDHNGYSTIHHAASRGDTEMVQYLIDHGADPLAVARTGQTTIDLANGPVQRINPFPETIALLAGYGAQNNNACVGC